MIIINPINNKSYNIKSKKGINVLNQYLKYIDQTGGSTVLRKKRRNIKKRGNIKKGNKKKGNRKRGNKKKNPEAIATIEPDIYDDQGVVNHIQPGLSTSARNMCLHPKIGLIEPIFSAVLGLYHNYVTLRNNSRGKWNNNLFTFNLNARDNSNYTYNTLKYSNPTSATNLNILAEDVNNTLLENGLFDDKIPIVLLGHSMGGLIAQYLCRVINKDFNPKLKYVQMNSPDKGTPLFNNCLVRKVCYIKSGKIPENNFAKFGIYIKELLKNGHDKQALRFISDRDAVVPYSRENIELLKRERNVTIIRTGHSAVLYNNKYINLIADKVIRQFAPKAHFVFCHGLNANPGQGIKLLETIRKKAMIL